MSLLSYRELPLSLEQRVGLTIDAEIAALILINGLARGPNAMIHPIRADNWIMTNPGLVSIPQRLLPMLEWIPGYRRE